MSATSSSDVVAPLVAVVEAAPSGQTSTVVIKQATEASANPKSELTRAIAVNNGSAVFFACEMGP